MTHKEYNGWTNYETWCIKLWMDNEEGSYFHWQEQAEEVFKDEDDDDRANALAERLKEQHEQALPEVGGFVADMLNAAMSEVNWFEIAESLLEDAKEAVES